MTEERAAQCFVFDGMTSWSARGPGVKLGKASTATQKPVADWWRQIIYVVRQGSILRRRDLVLAASNKDGGAHVDANLTPEYETLATTCGCNVNEVSQSLGRWTTSTSSAYVSWGTRFLIVSNSRHSLSGIRREASAPLHSFARSVRASRSTLRIIGGTGPRETLRDGPSLAAGRDAAASPADAPPFAAAPRASRLSMA